ncbi:putative Acetyltransferase family protein [Desulfosarcina cetonica]|uniref:GNAT family N-acetyltransferase n=1 Tax=Desulfosarcina cetonica TaxID=90730 RepID=UPI0006D0E123|nr:GNAT family N-acetyltransferase [Desulfosarcina cetonica]VTR70443.1 putative Acetyltransferase family protein [Desulfosarcina cetonica]
MIEIETAKPEDRSRVVNLLMENGMDYIDPIEDFTVARANHAIAGCIRTEQHATVKMIRPLVVASAYRKTGVGRLLLESAMSNGRPVVIVSRGESSEFYKAVGFSKADWEVIPDHQREECDLCPERLSCNPVPMICA